MKQKLMKYSKLVFIGLVFAFTSCEKDPLSELEEHGHDHGENPNEVSMEYFKQVTQIEDVGLFLQEKMEATATLNRQSSYHFSDFTIDTEIIYQCEVKKGEFAFSFRLYPKQDIALRDEVFNLVISKVEGQWRSTIYLLTLDPDERNVEKYNAVEAVFSESVIVTPIGARLANGYSIFISYHCTNTGKCRTEGKCDLCKLCVTRTVSRSFYFDEQENDLPVFKINEGGAGGGSGSSNHNQTVTTTPGEELTKLASSYNYAHTINHLKSKASGIKEFGWVYKYAPNSKTFVAPTVAGHYTANPNTVNLDAFTELEWIGAFHNHTKPSLTKMIPMFSPGDILWLWKRALRNYRHNLASNKPTNFSEFFIGLVNENEVYVVKIKDWNKFSTLGTPEKWIDFKRKLEIAYNESGITATQKQLQKDLLKELKSQDLGIGLYQQNEDGSWSEIILDPANNNNDPVKIPS